jgi:hypothetical protein
MVGNSNHRCQFVTLTLIDEAAYEWHCLLGQ